MKFFLLQSKRPNPQSQTGQTLIETIAACFILVMGVSAAVGLAVYAFNTSTSITKQIIATGLAREGLEAVRNMRDTNWLNDTVNATGCYNYATGQSGSAPCYTTWLNKSFCLDPAGNTGNACSGGSGASSMVYSLGLNSSGSSLKALWNLMPQNGSTNYGITLNSTDSTGQGFYTSNGTTACGGGSNPSDYCRKIIITKDTTDAPYNQDPDLPLLKVQSQVWWIDKKCPRAADFTSATVSCRLELDTYLTNWKNY